MEIAACSQRWENQTCESTECPTSRGAWVKQVGTIVCEDEDDAQAGSSDVSHPPAQGCGDEAPPDPLASTVSGR